MSLLISLQKNKLDVTDQSTKDLLEKGFYGTKSGKSLRITLEEAMYLMDVRNARCFSNSKEISFHTLSGKFEKTPKLLARYFAYKDWRDRGLIPKDASSKYLTPHASSTKKYPTAKFVLPKKRSKGIFFSNDLLSIVEDEKVGKELYEKLWLGQFGTYKAADRGKANKLDALETLLLSEKGILKLTNASKSKVATLAKKRRSDFPKLYEVYKDWRNHGYVVKSGFKFGTHFRVYFPGAKPVKDGNWVHSKHVIQVFPKESKLLISEWARAIRVAHSVRKTFILAIPGKASATKTKIDFILYHRKGGETENPLRSPPKYAMLCLSEEEYIGGAELSGAIKEAQKRKLELVLAIVDRETAVTYYKVRQIILPKSSHDYYEIDWMQP